MVICVRSERKRSNQSALRSEIAKTHIISRYVDGACRPETIIPPEFSGNFEGDVTDPRVEELFVLFSNELSRVERLDARRRRAARSAGRGLTRLKIAVDDDVERGVWMVRIAIGVDLGATRAREP